MDEQEDLLGFGSNRTEVVESSSETSESPELRAIDGTVPVLDVYSPEAQPTIRWVAAARDKAGQSSFKLLLCRLLIGLLPRTAPPTPRPWPTLSGVGWASVLKHPNSSSVVLALEAMPAGALAMQWHGGLMQSLACLRHADKTKVTHLSHAAS